MNITNDGNCWWGLGILYWLAGWYNYLVKDLIHEYSPERYFTAL